MRNVNREGIYFIWLRLKNRKAELKQQVKVSLAKYVGMFRHDRSYKIRFIFIKTKPSILEFQRIKTIETLPRGV